MDIRTKLLSAVDALEAADVPYAICGGLAVVIHGYTRLTDDIDLMVRPDDVPQAKNALQTAGFSYINPQPLAVPQQDRPPLIIHRMLHKHRFDPDMSEAAQNRRMKRLAELYDLALSLKKAVPVHSDIASPPLLVRESPAPAPSQPIAQA